MSWSSIARAGIAVSLLLTVGCCCCRYVTPCATAAGSAVAATPERTPEADQIFLDATILQVPAASLADYAPPDGARVLSKADADALLARATRDDVSVVAAPKVLALPGNEASMFVGETLHDGTWTGWRMRFLPELSRDATAVSLRVSFAMRPTPATGETVSSASIAEQERSGGAEVAALKSGDALRFTIPPRSPQDDPMVVVVRPQVFRTATRGAAQP